MEETELVALTVNAFSRFRKEVVNKVLEERLHGGSFRGLFPRRRVAPSEKLNHPVADVYLVIEVTPLKLVQLPVEFGAYLALIKGGKAVGIHELTVHRTHHIVTDGGGIAGDEFYLNTEKDVIGQFATA